MLSRLYYVHSVTYSAVYIRQAVYHMNTLLWNTSVPLLLLVCTGIKLIIYICHCVVMCLSWKLLHDK